MRAMAKTPPRISRLLQQLGREVPAIADALNKKPDSAMVKPSQANAHGKEELKPARGRRQ